MPFLPSSFQIDCRFPGLFLFGYAALTKTRLLRSYALMVSPARSSPSASPLSLKFSFFPVSSFFCTVVLSAFFGITQRFATRVDRVPLFTRIFSCFVERCRLSLFPQPPTSFLLAAVPVASTRSAHSTQLVAPRRLVFFCSLTFFFIPPALPHASFFACFLLFRLHCRRAPTWEPPSSSISGDTLFMISIVAQFFLMSRHVSVPT